MGKDRVLDIMKKNFGVVMLIVFLSLTMGHVALANSYKSTASHKPMASRSQARSEIADPIEPVNRFIFGFNDILDRFIIEPLARGYKAVLPVVVRNSIQSFMRNLESPVILANNILQGNIGDAGVTTARFLINSSVGIAGLVDVA
jgi:phospholipid-binding lipoprotein MlaA